MIAPPMSVLFPNPRFVGTWFVAAGVLILVLMFTPSGFPASNGGILFATAAAVLWASDCLRRMRQWHASTLVPGYATTAWAVAVGIVWCVTALATAISSLVGNASPAFGIATLAGTVLVTCLTFLHKQGTWQMGMLIVLFLGAIAYVADHRGVIPWQSMNPTAWQSVAFILAVIAVAGLRKRLGMPMRPHDDSVMSGRYVHPQVAAATFLFGWRQPRIDPAESIVIGIATALAMRAYAPFDYPAGLVATVAGVAILLASVTALSLLKVATDWLPTAWQLGIGDSRRDLGRSFAARATAMTLGAFGLAIAIAIAQAWLGGEMPSRPGLENHFDEALMLCAASLVVFTVACSARPTRTVKQPSHVGSLAVVCTVFLIVSFTAPSFGLLGRTILLAVVASSAALAICAGGRLVARFDFLPTHKD